MNTTKKKFWVIFGNRKRKIKKIMKMRKCTKCEKKFSAEELIKWKGNRYCDTYARIIESQNQITVENVTK